MRMARPMLRTVGLGDEMFEHFTICILRAENGFALKLPNWTKEDVQAYMDELRREEAEVEAVVPGRLPKTVFAHELMRPLSKLVFFTDPVPQTKMLSRLGQELADLSPAPSLGNIAWQNEAFEVRIVKLTNGYVVDFDRLVEINRLTYKRRRGTAVYPDWDTLRQGLEAFYDPQEKPGDEG